MIVSKELHAIGEKSLIQRNSSSKCIYEANYIEFACVKVVSNILEDFLSVLTICGPFDTKL